MPKFRAFILAAGASCLTMPGSASPQSAHEAEALNSSWDFWGALAGTHWKDEAGNIFSYNWKLPGEVLDTFRIGTQAEKTGTILLDADGAGLTAEDGGKMEVLRPGVSVTLDTDQTRLIYRRSGDTMLLERSEFKNGNWVVVASSERTRISEQEAAAAIAALRTQRQIAIETKNQAAANLVQATKLAQSKLKGEDYGHLAPTDNQLRYTISGLGSAGPLTATLFACSPSVDFSMSGARLSSAGEKIGKYYVWSYSVPSVGATLKYRIRAKSNEATGDPYFLAVTAPGDKLSEEEAQIVGPVCLSGTPTGSEIRRRFGDYVDLAGRSAVFPNGQVVDYEWFIPGKVLFKGWREWGSKFGCYGCVMLTYDAKHRKVRDQNIYAGGAPEFVTTKLRKDVKIIALRDDRNQAKAGSGGGGGVLGVLQGAIAGAQGMVDGGGGMDSALAGAAMGAVVGGAGVDAATINQSFNEGSYEVNQSNADAQRQLGDAIATANGSTDRDGALSSSSRYATSGTATPAATAAPIRPTTTRYLWCTTKGDGGVRYSSMVGTYQEDGFMTAGARADEGWLAYVRAQGISNFGGCVSKDSAAEIEAYKENLRRREPNGQWSGVSYTPSVPAN